MPTLGILGISGKMGKNILSLAIKDPFWKIGGGFCRSNKGKDLALFIGSSPIGAFVEENILSLVKKSDILIDFSHFDNLPSLVSAALDQKKPLVIGTTPLTKEHKEILQKASCHIPILYSANFSLGIALCKKMAKDVAITLKEADIDIVEIHHTQKKDSPSGTALLLKSSIEEVSQKTPSIHSLRAGKVIGEHQIFFHTDEEKIIIHHAVQTRDVFAKGSLTSAKFLLGKPKKFYTIDDLFAQKEPL